MHMPAPDKTGLVHIVGIGGIGMSAVAEVMHTRGYTVQGSDLKDSANLERLRAQEIRCLIGHDPANIEGAAYLVISSAVKAGNPEFEAAKERGIPIIRRAEMLAELMRPCATVSITGTHGKTTTTSLIADLLKGGGLDPTVITGGIINDWGTNARIGKGDWMVVEADESDGTFLKLPTQIGVVTNIDPEHMDYWQTLAALHQGFQQFIEAIPFYGLAVACIDHPVVRELLAKLGGAANGRRTLTYGVARDADIRLVNLRPMRDRIVFDADLGPAVGGGARKLLDLTVPVLGHFNALNALAALAVAVEAGVSDELIREAFAGFSGVKRRFTHVGEWQDVQIYDDYAHHPVEIAAVLRAARVAGTGRVIAVIQPHRYTRLQSLFNEFSACLDDADIALVTPVYSAGEVPIHGIDRDELASGLRRHGHPKVLTVDGEEGLVETVAALAQPGDLVVGLGAGTITDWINALPQRLADHGARMSEAPVVSHPAGGSEHRSGLMSELGERLPELRGKLKAGVVLADLTWFRVGGPADVLYSPADEADLAYFMSNTPPDIPVTIIGLGSNLLVRDGGIGGVVIRLGRGFGEITIEAGSRLRAGAAVPDVKVARAAADAGIAGLSFYRGIPGCVGGALRMNGGAHGRETKEVLVEACAVDRQGRMHVLPVTELDYAYRHCGAPEDLVFTEALFQGEPGDPERILDEMDDIAAYREQAQPIKSRTGGSTFKNPPGNKAWQLIDAAGCRGLEVGGAKVSEMHCNFLINEGSATGADLEELGETVRARVKAESGVELEWEIKRLGVPA